MRYLIETFIILLNYWQCGRKHWQAVQRPGAPPAGADRPAGSARLQRGAQVCQEHREITHHSRVQGRGTFPEFFHSMLYSVGQVAQINSEIVEGVTTELVQLSSFYLGLTNEWLEAMAVALGNASKVGLVVRIDFRSAVLTILFCLGWERRGAGVLPSVPGGPGGTPLPPRPLPHRLPGDAPVQGQGAQDECCSNVQTVHL